MADPVNFETLETPNPEEIMIRVRQDCNQLRVQSIPKLFTPYKNVVFQPQPRVSEFGDYLYVKMAREGQFIWFYFGKPKTQVERNIAFQSWYATRQNTWDAVLEDMYAIRSTTYPQSLNINTTVETAPRIFGRYRYRPPVPYNSIVLIEQYLAPTPWPKAELDHPQPVPTDVQCSYVGVNLKFERCLHPRVDCSELVPNPMIVQGVGTTGTMGSRNPGAQIFPATNFIDHAPFYIADTQEHVNGMFLRERVLIYPPPPPDPVFA